jgi:choline dehydrogenase-like flavoprotein
MIDHPFASWIDKAGDELGYHPFPMSRAILTQNFNQRNSCSYSVYCGSYGCATGAKGSSRAALLDVAIRTGRCEVRPNSMVYKLESDAKGKVESVKYFDREGNSKTVDAKIFVVACQAVETSRLLLMSKGSKHPNGLGNNTGQVGINLIFSAGGIRKRGISLQRFF